jgi:hypothetical protein
VKYVAFHFPFIWVISLQTVDTEEAETSEEDSTEQAEEASSENSSDDSVEAIKTPGKVDDTEEATDKVCGKYNDS